MGQIIFDPKRSLYLPVKKDGEKNISSCCAVPYCKLEKSMFLTLITYSILLVFESHVNLPFCHKEAHEFVEIH